MELVRCTIFSRATTLLRQFVPFSGGGLPTYPMSIPDRCYSFGCSPLWYTGMAVPGRAPKLAWLPGCHSDPGAASWDHSLPAYVGLSAGQKALDLGHWAGRLCLRLHVSIAGWILLTLGKVHVSSQYTSYSHLAPFWKHLTFVPVVKWLLLLAI